MSALVVGAVVIALVFTLLYARRAALRLRDETVARARLAADGIVAGAQEIDLDSAGNRNAVLLLHGGGDTPQTFHYLAEYLHARGYNVRAPLLPGHGRTLREFSSVSAKEWLDAARNALDDLSSRNAWVGVAGLSMGGALAVRLAADQPDTALVLLAPYLAIPRKIAMAARLAALWGIAVPYVRALDPTAPRSIRDPAEMEKSLAYGVFTPAALRALRMTVRQAFAALPRVKSPTLVIQSREDNRITPADAQRAFDRLGARDKKLVWTTGAGHVITVDYGKERVFELLTEWLERHRTAAHQERSA